MALLVLGVGYIGSALVREALARGERVVALDNFFSSDESAVAGLGSSPDCTFIRGSITDPGALDAAFGAADDVSAVYLLAAQASANPLAATADYTEEVNLRGPRLVLEAMRRHGARTLVFGSATRVYGDSIPADADESTPYGRFADLSHLSKVYVEKLLEMHAGLDSTDALRCLAIRLGLVYGVAPVMKTDYRFMTAPNKFCLQAVRGEPLVVNGGNEVGLIHVADAAGALLFAAGHDFGERYVALNAATEVASIAEVARLVEEAGAARGLEVRASLPAGVATRPARPLDSRLTRAGFAPRHDLRAGVAEALAHFAAPKPASSVPRLRTRNDDPASATTSSLVLLKCRATPEQLADRLAAPAPEGLELYLATEDIDGENWLERTVERIAAQNPPPGFAIVVEGPLRSLDGEFFDLTRDTPANRLVVERLAALGKALGAGAANVHAIAPTLSTAALGREANAAALRASLPLLSHYADVCMRAGLAPLVENIPPVARMREGGYWFTPIGMAAEDLVWLRRAVPDVGFTVDLSHAQLYVNAQRLGEGEVEPALRPLIRAVRAEARCDSLLDYVAVAAEGIVNVHVANATGLLGEGAPYGEGDADLDPVIARLATIARYIVTETLEPDSNRAVLMREAQSRLLKVRDRVSTERATTDGRR
jgi:nucleoside-diphosphate-sugar epimerase